MANKQTTQLTVRISTIRQGASKVPNAPGNLIINDTNGQAQPSNWFSIREWRNALLGLGLPTGVPFYLFAGATLTFERLEVTQADLDAGNGQYIHQFQGTDRRTGKQREVAYKQVGIHNINLRIDLRTMPAESQMMIAELGMKYRQQPTMQPAQAAPAIVEPLTNENIPAPADNPVVPNPDETPVPTDLVTT